MKARKEKEEEEEKRKTKRKTREKSSLTASGQWNLVCLARICAFAGFIDTEGCREPQELAEAKHLAASKAGGQRQAIGTCPRMRNTVGSGPGLGGYPVAGRQCMCPGLHPGSRMFVFACTQHELRELERTGMFL